MKKLALLLTACLILAPLAAKDGDKKKGKKPKKETIEVCFVLDTTGSMGGLIEGAKQKIWAIANEILASEPTPNLRIGLIGYRDRKEAYVTQVHDLSDDIDDIYAKLMKFQAQGGGDTPESVNQALHEAVTKIKWNKSKKVLKLVFLVGDAPPHMDYQDDVKYPEICKLAAKNNIILNTVQCGSMASTTPIWKEIAKLAEGDFVAIAQSGGVAAISTPVDAEIAKLNRELGVTVVAYGRAEVREVVGKKLEARHGGQGRGGRRPTLRSFVEVKSIGGPEFSAPLPLPGLILTEMATWLPDWLPASTITTRSKRRNSPMS